MRGLHSLGLLRVEDAPAADLGHVEKALHADLAIVDQGGNLVQIAQHEHVGWNLHVGENMVEKHSEMHFPRVRIIAGHDASGRAFLEIVAIVGDMHAEVALLGHVLETLLRDMHRKVFKRGGNLAQHRRVHVKVLE